MKLPICITPVGEGVIIIVNLIYRKGVKREATHPSRLHLSRYMKFDRSTQSTRTVEPMNSQNWMKAR